jgi:hypothetical protein
MQWFASDGGMTDQPKIPLSHAEIDAILQRHSLWLSGHKDGVRADFSNRIINGYNFSGKPVFCISFYNASIYNCTFAGTNLNDASFIAAEIVRCDFTDTEMDNVDFSWSSVKGCIFTGSTHLSVKNFKRANLKGSIFPEGFSFDGMVTYTDHLIKKARNVFGVELGFSITTLLLLLFGNTQHAVGLISLPLPLVAKEVSLGMHAGLFLNFIIITMIGVFYSLSMSSIKKQLDKIPAVFPDGRFAYETVFPWFWVTWIGEIWQTDYSKATGTERHLLWQRFIVLSSLSNILFVTIFVIVLLAFRQYSDLSTFIDSYQYWAVGLIAALFGLTLSVAYKTREKFYAIIASISALTVWTSLYFSTDFNYTLLVAFAMIVAWWCDTFTYSNEPFSMDMSIPESNHYSDSIKAMHRYVQPRFEGMNIVFGALFCLATALYVFHKS